MGAKWYGEKVALAIGRHLRRNLAAAARVWVRHARAHVGRTPGHSAPGGYPHKQTGDFRASITHEPDPVRLRERVGTNILYGRYLEEGRGMAPRPWMTLTNNETRSEIIGMLEKPMRGE